MNSSDRVLIIVASINGFVALLSLLITLLIRGKQRQMHEQINGQQEKLFDAVAGKNFAEGKEAGREIEAGAAKKTIV